MNHSRNLSQKFGASNLIKKIPAMFFFIRAAGASGVFLHWQLEVKQKRCR